MNAQRAEVFFQEYRNQLIIAVRTKPADYMYGEDFVPTVVARMRQAIENGRFNKDSVAIKKTCKALAIKHTYAAINEYLGVIIDPEKFVLKSAY